MNFKKFISILLCLSILLSVTPLCVSAKTDSYDSDEFIDGEIVIYSTKEVEDSFGYLHTASDSDTVYVDFDDVGIDSIEELDTYSEEDNMYIAETDGDVKEICAELNKNGDIIAEPNYVFYPDSFEMPREITNNTFDYRYYQKWYMNDVLQVPQTWQDNNVTGSGVTIAIIDNGYDITGDDFPQNLWRNSKGTVGWNVCSNSDNIAPLRKSTGYLFNTSEHGSNVAGVIGMASNGEGGVGIAYGAQLMLIQAASYKNDSEEPLFSNAAVANAINYAVQNGADIISMSLGSISSIPPILIGLALNKAKEAGVLAVAAAGNDGYSTDTGKHYPAAFNTCLGVMAISESSTTRLTYFSNYDTSDGMYYEIAAPGEDILGCGIGGYSHMSGTSQATPIVAAVAALYMEKYPNRTIDQLKEDMLSTATNNVKAYSSNSYIYKSLNALAFLDTGEAEEIHNEHTWSEWTVSIKPTCSSTGVQNRRCTVCGETETETIPKLTHDYNITVIEPTCTVKGYSQYKCKNCSNSYKTQYTAALGHSYSDWAVTAYPTPQADGVIERECTRCHISETNSLENVICNCDVADNIISGVAVATDVEKFISENTIPSDAEVIITPTSGEILGTDSFVSVKYPNDTVIEYTIVIFGDINGDGWYDGTDSVIADCLVNGMLTEDALTQAEYIAADCNHDGVIDELDVSLLAEAGILAAQIDQSKGADTLATSSVYMEYQSLINQSITAEEESSTASYEPSPMPDYNLNVFEKIAVFFMSAWKYLFSFLPF